MKYTYYEAPGVVERQSVEGRVLVLDGLEPDETVLVLRARDPFALAAANLYRMMTEGVFGGEKADDLERAIDRMVAWREGHRLLLKDPD